jgi:two-component system cell cycle sensor histidine kinase/response regulator CckA
LDDCENLLLSNKEGRLTTQDPSEPRPDSRSSGQRQADQSLEEESRLQTALLDNIPGCIALILRKDTREIVASNRFARELGAVPGQTCFRTCAKRDDECPFCLAPELWATGQSQRIEVEYRGTWYEGTWVPLSEDLYVHYIFDISERKQTEEWLLRTQFVVDHSQDPIQWVDPEGRVLYVNDAACRRLGYSREELLSMSVSDIDVLAPQPWSSHFQEVGEGGSVAFESLHRAKDGEIFPVEVTVSYLNYGGREYSCATARDITERKRAEQESRIASRAIEYAAIGVLRLDREGRIREVNGYLCQMLGYSREELLEMTVFDVDTGLDQSNWARSWTEVMARESFTVESAHRTKSGRIVLVEISRSIVEFEGQEFDHAFIRDISERKRVEEALRESEGRYQTLVNLSPDVITVDIGGKYVFANPAAARLFGAASPRELVGMDIMERVHPDDREVVSQRAAQVRAGSVTRPHEIKVLRLDGSAVDVEASGARIEFDGSPANQVVMRDITERKRAQEALRLARFSIDFASDFTLWLGADGRFIDVSRSACTRLGYSRDELLGMSVFDVTVGLSPADWPDRWRKLGQGSLIFEKQYRTKGGEIFPVEISGTIFAHEGREYNLAVVRDITERKQAEEALRQGEERLRESQKMEAVGQLAGGIAHDFNNLLTAILGYSEMILASKASSLDEVRPDIEEIKHAGERASALTQQILAFSRRQILRPAALSLNEVLQGMESLLRRTLGEDIDLITLEHPQLDLTEVDRHQFEQALVNLTLNARDAMPSGGRLTLETANVELDEVYCRTHPEMAPGSYVMLSVSDTGVGMDPDTIDHAFEPFFTTKAFGEGSGLGLAVIHGIVTQSRGSISVHSEPGKGTTFKIYLPRSVQSDTPEEVVIPPHVSAPGHETVMVVEDEAALRGLVERILGGAGYTTLAFGSADEALRALGQGDRSIDLLLTDVILPGALQGHDLARAVLASRPGLPVLYISGYTRDALVHAGRLDEGVNLLEKPFTGEALATMVRTALDRPRHLE